jgi:hypothetical protein
LKFVHIGSLSMVDKRITLINSTTLLQSWNKKI